MEDHLKTRIGIATGWGEKNLPVYFAMLAEEISDWTEWKVTVHPWNGGWSSTTHRLLVKRKPTAFQDVVHHIQVLGIGQGKLLGREKLRQRCEHCWRIVYKSGFYIRVYMEFDIFHDYIENDIN